jgi:hypothetical protein
MMRRVLDLRIVRWELKLAYVIGAYAIGLAIYWTLRLVGLPHVMVGLVGVGVDLAAILLGARIFRGRGEPIGPPRERWRMTARPRLSTALGIVFVVSSAFMVLGFVLAVLGVSVEPSDPAEQIVGSATAALEYGLIGALYLRSAARLRRFGVPAKEPTFTPTVRIRP